MDCGAEIPGPLEAILLEPKREDKFIQPAENVVIGFSPGKQWISVYAASSRKKNPDYERFGYNLDEKRGSYGEKPYGVTKIIERMDFH